MARPSLTYDSQEQRMLHQAKEAPQTQTVNNTEHERTLRSLSAAESMIHDIRTNLAHAFRAFTSEQWSKLNDADVAVVMHEAMQTDLAGHALSYLPESRRSALNVQFFREAMRRGLPNWIVQFASPEVQADEGVQADVATAEQERQRRLEAVLSRKTVD